MADSDPKPGAAAPSEPIGSPPPRQPTPDATTAPMPEKTSAAEVSSSLSPSSHQHDPPLVPPRPAGWMYRGFRVFGREFWFASPKFQLFMVSMVCFLCPGMFNALSGLGGAGLDDPEASNHANTALNTTFAVVAFFSGTFANRLGLRLTLAIGGTGYCIYVAAFLCFAHTANLGFVIFAGAFLGFCAGLLWTAQGAIMISYPPEHSKGRYISWFWVIFNLGAVIGSLIPLGQNVNNSTGTVTDGTYAGFLVLTFVGALLALCLCSAHRVVRDDGSRVILMKNPSWQSEIVGLWQTLAHDRWIVLLFPVFFASNVFYTYQNQDFNLAAFNIRTRSLNDLLYWLGQIIGALIVGHALDYRGLGRATKARIAYAVLFVLTMAVWGGGWAWQKDRPTREQVAAMESKDKIDWTAGSEFLGPMFLYLFYGVYDAVWQTCVYWFIGALSNSGRKAANMAGFYKGLQSAGAAVWWRLDGTQRPYNTIFGATWGILAGGLLVAAPVVLFRVRDTTAIEEDLKDTDETRADVVPGVGGEPEKGTV